jgi:hypothetical protein
MHMRDKRIKDKRDENLTNVCQMTRIVFPDLKVIFLTQMRSSSFCSYPRSYERKLQSFLAEPSLDTSHCALIRVAKLSSRGRNSRRDYDKNRILRILG